MGTMEVDGVENSQIFLRSDSRLALADFLMRDGKGGLNVVFRLFAACLTTG